MQINVNSNKSVNFGVSVRPKMKYNIYKETKKFFNKADASDILELIENASDNYILDDFRMNVPNKREKSIFCDVFLTSKQKSGKSCLIHTFLGKIKDNGMKLNLLGKSLRNL